MSGWFTCALACAGMCQAQVVTWPAAPGTTATDGAYKVTVNGRPVDVMYIEKPSMADTQLQWPGGPDNLQPYYFAQFDADETVTVCVESTGDLSQTRILPTRRGVTPASVSAHRVTFKAKPPFKLAFEPQGRHRALVFSASEPERDVPSPDAAGVVYFKPGRHRLDKPLTLRSGQTLYLAPGAWVEGAVVGSGDNITMRGRGILSGLCWDWCKGPRVHMLNTGWGRNHRVEGITLVGAWHWCLVLENVENAVVRNVNILNGHVLNDDGIDVVRSKDVSISDVFIRSQDDCIAPKHWCENLRVENCILWTDVANIFRIGYECDAPPHRFTQFRVKGIDVLHQSIRKPAQGHLWSENAVYLQASNGIVFDDMVFEDFRFDAPEAGDNFVKIRTQRTDDRWQKHKEAGHIRNITFRNIAFPQGLPPAAGDVWIENDFPDRTIENVRFEGLGAPLRAMVRGSVKGLSGLDGQMAEAPARPVWDVRRFGAAGDGRTLDTAAIQRAVDACGAAGGGRVLVPAGVYVCGSVRLWSGVNFHLAAKAELRGSRNVADYALNLPPPYAEDRVTNKWSNAILRVVAARDVSITGEPGSVINGQNCYDPTGEEKFRGPHAICAYWATNLVLRGYSVRDAGNYGHYIRWSVDVSASRVSVSGGHDGFDFYHCERAEVADCDIHTGDDCIAGHGSREIAVRRCRLSSSCSYFRIGGNGILVEDCEGSAPGRYPWRWSLSLAEKRDGVTPEKNGRRNTLSCFTFFSGRTTKRVSTGIVFRNCRFAGVDEMIHYNLSGNERWQCGLGLGDVTFENVTVTGLNESLCVYAPKGTPLNLTFRQCRIGFRKPVDVLMRGAEPGRFVIDGLDVTGVTGPFFRSWGGRPVFEVRGLTGVKAETVQATEPFVEGGI